VKNYLPFRLWITALFIVVAVVAPAIAWPSRGKEDAFIDRRDAIGIAQVGHYAIERAFKSLGGDKGIAEHNAFLESLVSIEGINRAGTQGDSTVIRVTVLNRSKATIEGVAFVDKRPRKLTETNQALLWIESPAGWSVKAGTRSTFQTRIKAGAIPELSNIVPYIVSQRIKGKDELTGYWSSGKPSSVLSGYRKSVR
jgi:hypothetical protein